MCQEPFKELSVKRSIPSFYKHATILYVGGACFIYILCHFLRSLTEWNQPPLIPGISELIGLYLPALYFWGGIMLRERFKNLPQWIYVLAFGIIAVAAISYLDIGHKCVNTFLLLPAMLCIGYLVPPFDINLDHKSKGWFTLAMALLAVFSYTAISVVKSRFMHIILSREQADTDNLLFWLLAYSRTLLAILASYLSAQFSFSKVGQMLGGNITIKWVAIISCILTFVFATKYVLVVPYFIFIGHESFIPLMNLIIQPVLISVIFWSIKRIKTKWIKN